MVTNTKVISVAQWKTIQNTLGDKKVIQCHGVFDLLHIGHIKHLTQAKSFGDILVVTITPDKFVNKGPGHPAFTDTLRAEAIAALKCTDYVIINSYPTAIEIIGEIKPHYYVKGDEYQDSSNDITGKISDEQRAVERCGGEIRYTTDITFSSSSLINRYLPTFPEQVQKWLYDFGHKYPTEKIFDAIDSLQDLRVLVIGETIVDEYHYCTTMGKSGKEPVLATKFNNEERYAGGALAVANHIAAFTEKVNIVSFIGQNREHEKFIKSKLVSNITPYFLEKEDSPTLVKRRFVERGLNQKLFEVYEMNDEPLSEKDERDFLGIIDSLLSETDLVIVTDYGHGVITPAVAGYISEKAPFLVVNTQANAGNHGMNSAMKYPHIDFLTMTGRELALEMRQKGDIKQQTENLSRIINAKKILVTAGGDGLVYYDALKGFFEAPAFAVKVTDRVGAGDTVLSIAALMVFKKIPEDIICFLGNVVGAEAVSVMGNSKFLNKTVVKKHLSHLLK